MKPSLLGLLREAFNARPIGMFIPPNWVGLALFGLLGATQNPGWLAIGAGVELGYLALLATHPRFQRFVAGKVSLDASGDAHAQGRGAHGLAARRRQAPLRRRCASAACRSSSSSSAATTRAPGFGAQSDSLGRLTWMYLRLLATRQAIVARAARVGRVPGEPPPLPGGAAAQRLETRLAELRHAPRRSRR